MAESTKLVAEHQHAYSKIDSRDEVDIIELLRTIWLGRWIIIITTFLFLVLASGYSFTLPNQYKSAVILTAAQKEGGGGLGGLAAQYGGLAAMAGISLGKDSGKLDQAVELLKSWSFINKFVNKYDIKPEVVAAKKWDRVNNSLIYDQNIYDPIEKSWRIKASSNESLEPSSWTTYKIFSSMMSVNLDVKTGMLTIGIEHYSPLLAATWASSLAKELNQHYQSRDIAEAKNNIEYLQKKISETSIAEMQAVFYGMIETQTKTLMLAEVSEEYLIRTIVPAMIPEEKSKPRRSFLVMGSAFVGFFISLILVFIRSGFVKGEIRGL